MPGTDNKDLIREAMAALATGDAALFGALMAEDFVWRMIGSNSWSGEYRGRDTVRRELFKPLFEQFTTTYTNRAINIIGEGDQVVVECRGHAETRSGVPYDQSYCYVIRMRDGQMVELTEYMDTALVERALGERTP